jgi:hypothetical protein
LLRNQGKAAIRKIIFRKTQNHCQNRLRLGYYVVRGKEQGNRIKNYAKQGSMKKIENKGIVQDGEFENIGGCATNE